MSPIAISLTRYHEPNSLLREALESLARQKDVEATVWMLDQHADDEIKTLCADLSTPAVTFRYEVIEERGLSFARNCAIARAGGDVLLFLDADAIADPSWAGELSRAFETEDVAIAGGKIVPKWHGRPPLIARASIVREQYSMLDLGDHCGSAEKVIGAGFGIHITRLGDHARFDEGLGRAGGRLFGGEETDLCDRARDARLGIVYNGRARIQHQVLPERLHTTWLLRRFYYAGITRARRGGRPNSTHKTRGIWEWLVLPVILPPYVLGQLVARLLLRRP